MIVETIAVKTAGSILSKLTSWGFSEIIKNELTGYEKELSKIIQQSIEEYKVLYPIEETNQIPFYSSLVIVEECFKFRFTSKLDDNIVIQAIEQDERIIKPTKEQLFKFLEIFNSKVGTSEKLKKLNIDSNYKEEIFEISRNIKEVSNKINDVKNFFVNSSNELKTQFDSLSVTSTFIQDWSKQLDEILNDLKHFKPFTAQERLKNLEKRIIDAGLQRDEKIFSRLYYMQAICLGQMEGMDISNDEALLLVKAYRFNKESEEYKGNAALAYFVLDDKETAASLAEALLIDDKFNVVGWVVKCFLAQDNFRDTLSVVPKIVKNNKIFKIHLYHWLFRNKYIEKIKDFEDLDLGFYIDTSEKSEVNYLNRHYSLLNAQYLLTKYYETQKNFNIAIYYPSAKEDAGYVYGNKILKEVFRVIKGSEVEQNHDYYLFLYYCSCLILDEDNKHVHEMEIVFSRLKHKPIDVVVRMAQAYNNLNEDSATQKATQILEEFVEEPNDIIVLFNLINFSILKNQFKVEEYFIKYLDSQPIVTRDFTLNMISFMVSHHPTHLSL